jgi:hypothetical protein
MPKDGNDSDSLGDTHPAFWTSHFSAADERRIRRECFIPSFIKLRFDENNSGALARSDIHEVCVYEHMFKAGFRLPFVSIIRELLGFLNLSPHQLSPNAWRTFFACVILWPLALGRDNILTIKEFLHLYRLQKNPQSAAAYNFQTKKEKFIQIDSQFSSNPKWKNKYFFVSGQWEFTPTEKAKGPRVPRDINEPPAEAHEEPVLTPEMISRVNKVIKWGREHPKMMFVGSLITSPRLSEFVYNVDSFRLRQLSFASRVRDSAWADGLHLGFETFRTWWRDPARKMDLNSVNIEDIPMTKEAIRQLISLGREEMPDAVGIDRFAYLPEAAPESGEAEKEHDDAENPLPAEDPPT